MEKRLYKSSHDKVLAGVCGGIGEYFAVDPVIIRLLVVVFTLMGGAGLVAYIIAAIIVPSRNVRGDSDLFQEAYRGREGSQIDNGDDPPIEAYEKDNGNTILVLGIIFVGVGGLVALRYFIPWIPGHLITAVIFIALGFYLIFRQR